MCEFEAVHGGDSGIILAFLMNPVSLRAGEAAYIPPRQIHAYQRGLGIEVMAASDNVIRAGLTHKHVDSAQLGRNCRILCAPSDSPRSRASQPAFGSFLRSRSGI